MFISNRWDVFTFVCFVPWILVTARLVKPTVENTKQFDLPSHKESFTGDIVLKGVVSW